jgi:hypothetical protein
LALHLVELDMQLGFIRQTGLAQNRLLYVVFLCCGAFGTTNYKPVHETVNY